ncbi:TetR/AcrR family transcriptional regulator [Paraburkholderia sp. IW21]|uniref:TetR/AcrR family transcriptional regulator n=1 Tax=Paraburkholderia sp. IW21 TaxID=3242488 RepID=UPI0035200E0E
MGIVERKSRQKQALRERILDAARRIVMREGFAALSMRKIADAIEYSPATLYLHFASRDEIAQALCAEGFAQLLETFVPLAQIADPADRLKALGRAYVAFGVAHPETYRLIFMEDPSYTGAALGGVTAASGAAAAAASKEAEIAAVCEANLTPVKADDDRGDASLRIMIDALGELKAAGRLSASVDVAVWAEAFWATMHGIVALNLTCPVFPTAPLDKVVDVALDAWLGAQTAAQPQRGVRAARVRTKSAEAPAESHGEPGGEPASQSSRPSALLGRKSTKPPAQRTRKPSAKPDIKPATKPKVPDA